MISNLLRNEAKLIGFLISLFLVLNFSNAQAEDTYDGPVRVCAIAQLNAPLAKLQSRSKYKFELTSSSATNLYNKISNKELICDMYVGNDLKFPEKYILSGLADKTTLMSIGSTRLVLWDTSNIPGKKCSILSNGSYKRLAIADPKLQVSGFAATQVLKAYGVDISKILQNVLFAANDYQVMSFVISGTANTGIVPYVMVKKNSLVAKGSYCIIPKTKHEPLFYYAMVFNINEKQKQKAMQFRNYLTSQEVKKLFVEYGID